MVLDQSIRFSIIVPSYNSESFIARCVNSILNLAYPNFEIIVVDDGSTDQTVDVLHGFSDKRLKVIRKSHEGVSVARNTGINACNGDFVIFVDSDDSVDRELLTVCSRLINENSLDAVFYEANVNDSSGVEVVNKKFGVGRPKHFENRILDGETIFVESILHDQYIESPCLYAIKADVVKHQLFPPDMFYEDSYHTTSLLLCGKIERAICIKSKLYTRWTRNNSITTSAKSKLHFESYRKLIFLLSELISKYGHSSERVCLIMYRRIFYRALLNCVAEVHVDYCSRLNFVFFWGRQNGLKSLITSFILLTFPSFITYLRKHQMSS